MKPAEKQQRHKYAQSVPQYFGVKKNCTSAKSVRLQWQCNVNPFQAISLLHNHEIFQCLEIKQLFEKIGIAKFKDRQYLIKLERIRKGRGAEFQLGLGIKSAAPVTGDQRIIILNMERFRAAERLG